MTIAVGRLSDAVSGKELGTVFAATDRLALTAFHCVGDRRTGEITFRRVRCKWDQRVSDAVVRDGDQLNDVALVRFDEALPRELEPIPLVRDVAVHTPFVAPGTPAGVRGVSPFAASGKIAWIGGHRDDGAPVIQLDCRQSAAGLSLQGFSGAPVLVGQPWKAAGVLRWNLPRDDRPDLATGGAPFAAPSAEVLRRWPQLDPAGTSDGLDLRVLLRRLAERGRARSEAEVRADVRQLLLAGGLGLGEHDFSTGSRSQSEEWRGLAVRVVPAVIEVRKDLRPDGVVDYAEQQLDIGLAARSHRTGQRYVGVLTDGTEWRLYHRVYAELQQAKSATLTINPSAPNAEELLSWLEAVLATGQHIKPTPQEIARKLGAESPSYALDFTELEAIYAKCHDRSSVKVKRELWAKLLATASGTNFTDNDSLFIDHTLLVAMAKVVGHAVVGFRPEDDTYTAATIMSGTLFSQAQIGSVIEADFFDWIVDVPEGERFIKDLARRLTRFAWGEVEHDVMKVLYESIIPQQVRHRLGEYYTPDWLAEEIVAECVNDPLSQRVLDASCGSGTFLFHAVRSYAAAAETAGRSSPEIIREVVEHVIGFDVHPVAVTLARVTYLLAIGMRRLEASDRPGFAVPVYLSDSLRWGKELTLWSDNALSVPTDHQGFVNDPEFADPTKHTNRLRFPDRVVANTQRFDQLITELAGKAANRQRGAPLPSLTATLQRFGIHNDDDRYLLEQTFEHLCELHDEGRDHIWGYYARNLARPVWLTRPDNRIDVLVGNPPWLAYRYMTRLQQASFRAMSVQRGLWAGGSVATHQDLSALFVARCIELYLRPGGRFGYVMPLAALTRNQYAGFRSGHYSIQGEPVKVAFERPWDLHRIKPRFFRQAVGVVLGRRNSSDAGATPLDGQVPEVWSGRFETKTASRAEAAASIARLIGETAPGGRDSLYAARFSEGATVVPQVLFLVTANAVGPLGTGAGRRAVKSRRSTREKKPWKDLDSLHGIVEEQFIRPLHLGESVLPFRCLRPPQAVIPWDHQHLLHGQDERIDLYPGLAEWWRSAETVWAENRSSELSLAGQLDYRRKLTRQFPVADHRVVFSASGMYVAAAVVTDPAAVVEHQLYWGPTACLDEARFLTAILNSTILTMAVRHLQSRGEHNPRHFDKYIFRLPIPLYDPSDATHTRLVALAERAEQVAVRVTLPAQRFETQRRRIREALVGDGVGEDIDAIVKILLA